LLRNGANIIHGVDNNTSELEFCNKLFRNSRIPRFFLEMNLCADYAIDSIDRSPFNKTYDIVLFLSVYNKILQKKGNDYLTDHLMPAIELKCSRYLVIRDTSNQASSYNPSGFNIVDHTNSDYGSTFIYENTYI
jgi:hypothetical protein